MQQHFEHLTVDIATAVKMTAISRSSLYKLFETGQIKTKKFGRKTLIDYTSLKAFTDGLADGMGDVPASLARN